jgi:DNA-binding NarL/FixJ family response regulator
VLLADDQVLIRSGFRVLIDSAPDLHVVGEASDGAEAVALARATRADVVVMDIRMPGVDGIEATREICADDDLAGVRVLVLTTFEHDDHVVEAVRAGASGFLGKGVEPVVLLDAIRTVATGDALLSPRATRTLISRYLRPAQEPIAAPAASLSSPTGSARSSPLSRAASATRTSPASSTSRRSPSRLT